MRARPELLLAIFALLLELVLFEDMSSASLPCSTDNDTALLCILRQMMDQHLRARPEAPPAILTSLLELVLSGGMFCNVFQL